MDQGELEGMPEPAVLRLVTSDGHILVTWGRTLVYRYANRRAACTHLGTRGPHGSTRRRPADTTIDRAVEIGPRGR